MDLTPLSLYTGLSPQKREIFRFFVVGVSLTLGFTVIATGLRLATALRPSLISALSYAVMIGIGYVAQRVITFQSRVKHSKAFPRYVSVELLGLSISVAFSEIA
ncbi:MAG: GtrA family protein, partial [Methylobacteriaceae bacterium]|nr:GtrA family protein [Methylobacteriaceae bacterium]